MKNADCTLLCVGPQRVADILHHVRPLLESAARRSRETSVEAIEQDLAAGRALLWIAWGAERRIVAVLVTQLVRTAAGLVCVLVSCAGGEHRRWVGLLRDIERYAADEECVAMRIYGRKGWARVLKDYRTARVILEKSLPRPA